MKRKTRGIANELDLGKCGSQAVVEVHLNRPGDRRALEDDFLLAPPEAWAEPRLVH